MALFDPLMALRRYQRAVDCGLLDAMGLALLVLSISRADMSQTEIAAEARKDRKTIRVGLRKLVAARCVIITPAGGYRITPKGRRELARRLEAIYGDATS